VEKACPVSIIETGQQVETFFLVVETALEGDLHTSLEDSGGIA
jgi:hypothetical protein